MAEQVCRVQWVGIDRYDQLLKHVNNGELLEFEHGGYTRRGVYIGWYDPLKKYSVAQATLPEDKLPEMGNKSIIKYQPLEDLLKLTPNTKVRVNNFMDGELFRYGPDEVVRRAINAEALEYPMAEISNEHFAQWCRYKEPFSMKLVVSSLFSFSKVIVLGITSLVLSIPQHFRKAPENAENTGIIQETV